jgi:tRNA A58 N-methylase Trm61
MDWLGAHTPTDSVVFADEDVSAIVPVYTFDSVVWDVQAPNYLLPHARTLFTPDLVLSAGFAENIHKYRVDYVVWDTVKDPSWKMDQYKILRKVYETGGLKVYTFK